MAENKKYKSDIEIAREAKLQNILEIAEKRLNIAEKFLEPYGHYKANLSFDYINSLGMIFAYSCSESCDGITPQLNVKSANSA